MRLGVLFSGGKDSVCALARASLHHEIACLITLRSENPESYMFHTPNIHITSLQAEALGIPLVEWDTPGERERELGDLAGAMGFARDRFGIEGIVTGAIESVYQTSRMQRICHGMGLWCFNPLWKKDQVELLHVLVGSGYRIMISGVFAYPLTRDWLGRELCREMIATLEEHHRRFGLNPSGEGGELETTVLDAPCFRKRIVVDLSTISFRHNAGTCLIRKARLVGREPGECNHGGPARTLYGRPGGRHLVPGEGQWMPGTCGRGEVTGGHTGTGAGTPAGERKDVGSDATERDICGCAGTQPCSGLSEARGATATDIRGGHEGTGTHGHGETEPPPDGWAPGGHEADQNGGTEAIRYHGVWGRTEPAILVVDMNGEEHSLSYPEFVLPIIRILKDISVPYWVCHIGKLTPDMVGRAAGVILSGTPLMDQACFHHLAGLSWLRDTTVPILGICAGMQFLGRLHGARTVPCAGMGTITIRVVSGTMEDSPPVASAPMAGVPGSYPARVESSAFTPGRHGPAGDPGASNSYYPPAFANHPAPLDSPTPLPPLDFSPPIGDGSPCSPPLTHPGPDPRSLFPALEFEAYCLHGYALSDHQGLEVLALSDGVVQAFRVPGKHRIGLLFHPEVRNPEIVERFVRGYCFGHSFPSRRDNLP